MKLHDLDGKSVDVSHTPTSASDLTSVTGGTDAAEDQNRQSSVGGDEKDDAVAEEAKTNMP